MKSNLSPTWIVLGGMICLAVQIGAVPHGGVSSVLAVLLCQFAFLRLSRVAHQTAAAALLILLAGSLVREYPFESFHVWLSQLVAGGYISATWLGWGITSAPSTATSKSSAVEIESAESSPSDSPADLLPSHPSSSTSQTDHSHQSSATSHAQSEVSDDSEEDFQPFDVRETKTENDNGTARLDSGEYQQTDTARLQPIAGAEFDSSSSSDFTAADSSDDSTASFADVTSEKLKGETNEFGGDEGALEIVTGTQKWNVDVTQTRSRIDSSFDPNTQLTTAAERMSPHEFLDTLRKLDLPNVNSFLEVKSLDGMETEQIAERLIQRELLTAYQATLICLGSAAHLRINEYIVLERISRGGMGIVLLVAHQQTSELYALKLFEPREQSIGDRQRFEREMKAILELAHPNIAVAKGTGQIDDVLYIVLEYVDGPDLYRYVKEHGALDPALAVDYLLQAATGLAYAHDSGLIHRDVKPGNVMVNSEKQVKIVDMGLAKVNDTMFPARERDGDEFQTKTGVILGSVDFMAPEQAVRFRDADARSDIYSLGATLFYLVVGQSRLEADIARHKLLSVVHKQGIRNLKDHCPDLPVGFLEIYDRMVADDPEDRYETMHEVVAALSQLMMSMGAEPKSNPQIQVLIVEDSDVESMLVRRILERSNSEFEPQIATTCREAQELLLSHKFDLILTDLNLPDSFGIDTVTTLRCVTPSLPIVVLTGHDDVEVGVGCVSAGADDFLPKVALSVKSLERTILLAMSRKKTTRQRFPQK